MEDQGSKCVIEGGRLSVHLFNIMQRQAIDFSESPGILSQQLLSYDGMRTIRETALPLLRALAINNRNGNKRSLTPSGIPYQTAMKYNWY